MSGYIFLNRTGNKKFDAVLTELENAGNAFHHTSQWQDRVGWLDDKSYLQKINELIDDCKEKEK